MVAARPVGAGSPVCPDPRFAAAARKLHRSRVRCRRFRLRHLLAVYLPSRIRTGAGVAYAGAAGRADCAHGMLPGGLVLPGKSLLAQSQRDARLAGPAGAVGAVRMAARMAAERFSMAVARLRTDRFAPEGLGAAVRR